MQSAVIFGYLRDRRGLRHGRENQRTVCHLQGQPLLAALDRDQTGFRKYNRFVAIRTGYYCENIIILWQAKKTWWHGAADVMFVGSARRVEVSSLQSSGLRNNTDTSH